MIGDCSFWPGISPAESPIKKDTFRDRIKNTPNKYLFLQWVVVLFDSWCRTIRSTEKGSPQGGPFLFSTSAATPIPVGARLAREEAIPYHTVLKPHPKSEVKKTASDRDGFLGFSS
jgi:hypothetical protein